MKKGDSQVAPKLNDYFRVADRFCRSVNLQHDWKTGAQLQGYLPTDTVRGLAARIATGALSSEQPKAWSVTGPYGSGKSAFALFLADMLARRTPSHQEARRLRDELGLGGRRLFPLLLVGQRAPLAQGLLEGIAKSVLPLSKRLTKQALRAARSPHADEQLLPVLRQVEAAALKNGYAGTLLVVDEFGKYLEYAGLHQDEVDFFVLQQIAEAAARSSARPFVFVTILHTAFAEYAGRLDAARRAEWQKVQGRFADVAFHEPAEQFLALIENAIERRGSHPMVATTETHIARWLGSDAFEEPRRRLAIDRALAKTLPLHPVVSLLLWPVFRGKLAQNERSLFAFLGAKEPLGFQDFLNGRIEGASLPLYRLDQLYDYVVHTLREAALRGDRARRWAEIEAALSRIPGNAPLFCPEVVKTIGLLGLFGASVGLRATDEVIGICLGEPERAHRALKFLKEKSIVVYRRHDSSYGLWEGSDVDLDELYDKALNHVQSGAIASRIQNLVPLQPIVARSHYIKKGTLRYFSVQALDATEENIKRALSERIKSDGLIAFFFSASPRERDCLFARALELSGKGDHPLRVLAFPKPLSGLEAALREAEAWAWARENEPRLEGDPVARREVQVRWQAAMDDLLETIGRTFGLSGHEFDPSQSDWIYGGKRQSDMTSRELLEWLSSLCASTFRHAPVFRNELLNREQLSSAAAAARRNLVEKLIERSESEKLGIEGFPPEFSMYASMLKEGGFHVKRHGEWQIGAPSAEWQPVWRAMDTFLESTHHERRPVTQLFDALRRPPFGLKEGPLPVLLCCLLLSKKGTVALYEEGVFVPELRIEVVERLLRAPDEFEIQEHPISPVGRGVLEALGRLVAELSPGATAPTRPHIVEIARPLTISAARLPIYSRQTRRIQNPRALAVRDALIKAKDPFALVFRELPALLGVTAEQTKEYTARLSEALLAMQRAYPQLLDDLERQIRETFGLTDSAATARRQLQARALPLIGKTADPALTTLVRELANIGERDWREVVAIAVNRGLPPTQWQDSDVASFQLRLTQLAKDFIRIEEMVAEQRKSGAGEIIRIGILNGQVHEARAVVAVEKERARDVISLSARIHDLLRSMKDRRLALAAVARVAATLLDESSDKSELERVR